jgi:hypothetical protein
MFDASNCSPIRIFIILIFSLFSAMEVWFIYLSVEPGAASFLKYFWDAYAACWLLVNVVFGGIHNAPSWSFIPITAIAVVAQNILAWFLARKAVAVLRNRFQD